MKRWIVFALLVSVATPANAYLKAGSGAPDFSAQATLGGKEFTFRLSEALKRGPVVLYFYPAAFTMGCTIEAHNFAEAVPQFKMLNATVLGVSQDNIKTLDKFSVQECRSAFPVAADTDGAITKSYDAQLSSLFAVSDRTSYVISPKGDIIYAYRAMDPDHHASNALEAVKRWVHYN
jgi:peroxiredoxin Q/BCP